MSNPELCYIYDMLCGWCYGTAPVLAIAKETFGDALTINLLHGGLFTGSNAYAMPDIRPIALEHDKRIHEITGQVFSQAYHDNIVMNDDVVHDSIPTAIAHQIVKLYAPDRMLEFLQAAQYARFVEGIDLTNWAAYVSIVKPFGITPKQFFDGFYNDSNIREATQTEFNYAHELMETVRAQGFPTILLINNGIPIQIPHGHLLKVPTDIVPKIQELLE